MMNTSRAAIVSRYRSSSDVSNSASRIPDGSPGKEMIARLASVEQIERLENLVSVDYSNSSESPFYHTPPECESEPQHADSNSPTQHPQLECTEKKSCWGCICHTLFSWSTEQTVTFVIIMVGTLTASFAICLFPPFFPDLAEQKKCPYYLLGIIIGQSCLVSFFSTPFLGRYLDVIRPKFAFVGGSILSAGCCALSGFLEDFPADYTFILGSLILRGVHAAGNALVIVSTFAYIAVVFPDTLSITFAWTRTAMNTGQCIGPIFAGMLIDVQSFKLPFIVMGIVQFITGLLSAFYLNNLEGRTKSKEKTSFLAVLKVLEMYMPLYACVVSTMSNGFLTINLEPQVLRHLVSKKWQVGALFGLKDGVNSLVSPLWGYCCDKGSPKIVILVSSLFAAASFVLIGPFPGLPMKLDIFGCALALTLNGIAVAGLQVAGMVEAYKNVMDHGLPDCSATHGMVAGLWTSVSSGGRFIARSVASPLVVKLGFRVSSSLLFYLNISVILLLAVLRILCCKANARSPPGPTVPSDKLGIRVTQCYDQQTRRYSRLVSMSYAPATGESTISKSLEILNTDDEQFISSVVRRRVTTSDIESCAKIF